MESIVVREKTTSDIVMQLFSDDEVIDLTDVDHIEMNMIDSYKNTYHYSSDDESPALVITTPLSGIITFTPPSETIFLYQRSSYRLYVWIYETATKKYAVPENGYAEIKTTREF